MQTQCLIYSVRNFDSDDNGTSLWAREIEGDRRAWTHPERFPFDSYDNFVRGVLPEGLHRFPATGGARYTNKGFSASRIGKAYIDPDDLKDWQLKQPVEFQFKEPVAIDHDAHF